MLDLRHALSSNDTIILKDIPFSLHVNYNGNFNGAPTFYGHRLQDLIMRKARVQLRSQNDITYVITVTTPQGCRAKDSVSIIVFKGSAAYVPTGFTPNGDGK